MKHIELKTVCLAAVMLLAGCVKEAEVKTNDTRGDVTVRMNLNVPGHVVTRGLSVAQEDAVRTIDLLVFDKDLELIDLRHGEILNREGELSLLATIRASKDAQDVFRLMVLANVRGTLHNILGDGDDLGGHKGKSYSAMVGILEAAVSDYPHILRNGLPMWGEPKDPLLLMAGEITVDEPLDMLRSLARIDVGTNPTPAFAANGKITGWDALPNFSLEEVHVYNANTHYALSARAAYNFTGGAAGTVNGYTLPSTAGKHSDELPYSDQEQGDGTVLRATGGKGVALTGSIYAGEANVKMGGAYGDANHTDRMALVVGGRYSRDTAHPNTTGEMSYYRLDFTSGTAAALMDILRNRDYQIVITSCSGPGKPTPDEAFETVKVDMTAIVRAWDTEYENDFDFGNQYYLKVNKSAFMFEAYPDTQTLEVETDYPGGWRVAEIKVRYPPTGGGLPWIRGITTSTAGGTGKTSIDIKTYDNTDPKYNCLAEITIKAGNMSKTITFEKKLFGLRNVGNIRGVIGYIHNPGKFDHHHLTLDPDDGDDTNGIVYVAHFKFNSLVAIDSERRSGYFDTDFSAEKVIAWPTEWAADRAAMEAIVTDSGHEAWDAIPYVPEKLLPSEIKPVGPPAAVGPSFGDPCAYYFGTEWKTPTAEENSANLGGLADRTPPDGERWSYAGKYTTSIYRDAERYSIYNPAIARFPASNEQTLDGKSVGLPIAGFRYPYHGDLGGARDIFGDYGYQTARYWTSDYDADSGKGISMQIDYHGYVKTYLISGMDTNDRACPVRCISTLTRP